MAHIGSLIVQRKFIPSVRLHVDLTYRVLGHVALVTRRKRGAFHVNRPVVLLGYAGIAPRWVQ